MRAEKGNKVYTIDEKMKDRYAADGYDIKNDDGKVVKYGSGKKIPYEDYIKLVKENEELRNQVKELQGSVPQERTVGVEATVQADYPEKKTSKKAGA